MEAPYGKTLLATEVPEGTVSYVIHNGPAFSRREADSTAACFKKALRQQRRIVVALTMRFDTQQHWVSLIAKVADRDRIRFGHTCCYG